MNQTGRAASKPTVFIMFVDRVRIWARAGKGGDGCVSFRREKFIPRGGPDGGNGGTGGDVILVVNPNLNNLVHLKLGPHHFAEDGRKGSGANRTGRDGQSRIIEVPCGTAVYRVPENPDGFERAGIDDERELAFDMLEPGQKVVLCAGGNGGRGNLTYKSSVTQAPTRFTSGREGERGQFIFELKSIADVGFVGYPNAGKSSLLGAISAAHPKVASYPFTTLTPMVGVVEYPDYKRIQAADIPGIVEGAHAGVGLGHDFLRHIERCRLLAFVLDMGGTDGRNPIDDFQQLRKELDLYQPELSKRPFVIVANKMDLPESAENLKALKKRFRREIIPISAQSGEGLDVLKDSFRKHLISEESSAPA
jgi:GTP-binding protein